MSENITPPKCETCGEEMPRKMYRTGPELISVWTRKRFCSPKCQGQARKISIPAPKCIQCGSDIQRRRSKAGTWENSGDYRARLFCNQRCRGDHRIKERSKLTCGYCGKEFSRAKGRTGDGMSFCCRIHHNKWMASQKITSRPPDPDAKTEEKLCPCGEKFMARKGDTRTYHSPACLLAHL